MRRLLLAFLLASTTPMVLGDAWVEPNWDRRAAHQAIASRGINALAHDLVARAAAGEDIGKRIDALLQDERWPAPARDALVHQVALGLGDLPPLVPPPTVIAYLRAYEVTVLVAHEEVPTMGVPLFPVAAVAAGLEHRRVRAEARRTAADLLQAGAHDRVLATYRDSADRNVRAGTVDGVMDSPPATQQRLLEVGLASGGMLALLGPVALAQQDAIALEKLLINAEGPAVASTMRGARERFAADQLEDLLAAALRSAPAATAGVVVAELGPVLRARPRGRELLQSLDGTVLASAAALARTKDVPAPPLQAQAKGQGAITAWTEEDGVLGLGYPVPVPVDTPLPFDGFRSYDGLHSRHQALMADTDLVHGEVVGSTHNGREIWAYRMGDADRVTRDGLPEPAMLTNGGIHAREWQTPEVVTGIMELLAERSGDRHFYDYLLDNANIVLIPVQNVDGLIQTQRTPALNWLRTDPTDVPDDPFPAPRDGRMRRKNMPGVDESLESRDDHLLGVDLNRNNGPFWATNPDRSSDDETSLVHHGIAPFSEPEAQALLAAAELGPLEQLSTYTDVHSFSQVFYFNRTGNLRLTRSTLNTLGLMSGHNAALPGTLYLFDSRPLVNVDAGIGLTNEYFASELGVVAWGVEVEPSQGQSFFPDAPPGCGADYGGLARNCHDGFILPESEIRRVRNELSRSFAAVYYRQAGPPSVETVQIIDPATRAVVLDAAWDPLDAASRQRHHWQSQPLELGRDYELRVSYNQPMRWQENGEIADFPGVASGFRAEFVSATERLQSLSVNASDGAWTREPGDYLRYEFDTWIATLRFADNAFNRTQIGDGAVAQLGNSTFNMVGLANDADPSTPARWGDGGWDRYEDSEGVDGNDEGGIDQTPVALTLETQPAPFVVEPGTSAAWFDPTNAGQGFIIEKLADDQVVMYWFTFDAAGDQAWYIGIGSVEGNQLRFSELIRTSGGRFGPDFDPTTVERTVVGSADFLYDTCDTGTMVYEVDGVRGRLELQRLSRVMGLDCGAFQGPPVLPEAIESGSWIDPQESGHGFVVEVLADGRVLIYWFSYDFEGNQAWFFGTGAIEDGELVVSEVFRPTGPAFGPSFDPDDLQLNPWGSFRFDLGCAAGSMAYDGGPGGFGAASLDLVRLTRLDGLACE